MADNIETIYSQFCSTTILLRNTKRDGKRIRKTTIANLSQCSPKIINGFRAIFKGGTLVNHIHNHVRLQRSLPYGHVKAALLTTRKLGLKKNTPPNPGPPTLPHSCRQLETISGNEMLLTLDRLLEYQSRIE